MMTGDNNIYNNGYGNYYNDNSKTVGELLVGGRVYERCREWGAWSGHGSVTGQTQTRQLATLQIKFLYVTQYMLLLLHYILLFFLDIPNTPQFKVSPNGL